jgi:hypothetical protein
MIELADPRKSNNVDHGTCESRVFAAVREVREWLDRTLTSATLDESRFKSANSANVVMNDRLRDASGTIGQERCATSNFDSAGREHLVPQRLLDSVVDELERVLNGDVPDRPLFVQRVNEAMEGLPLLFNKANHRILHAWLSED